MKEILSKIDVDNLFKEMIDPNYKICTLQEEIDRIKESIRKELEKDNSIYRFAFICEFKSVRQNGLVELFNLMIIKDTRENENSDKSFVMIHRKQIPYIEL